LDFYIKEAILHLYDVNQQALNISKQLLDLSQPVIHDYILKKLERAYSDKLKSGQLEANHPVVTLAKNENFIQSSVQFCQQWLEAYKIAEKQSANDLICVRYEQEGIPYFGFIRVKLNQGFANQTGVENNQIQVNPYQLPSDSQLPDEAFLLNLTSDEFLLLEKQIKFNGANIKYFSETILKAPTNPSVNDQLRQIKQTAKKIGKTFDAEEFQMASTIQKAVVASLDEAETFDPKKISESLFPENLTAQLEFQEATKDSVNLKVDEAIKAKTTQKLSTQKLSLSYGIEITVPNDVYDDAERVEFIQNADGTYSILIKNITDIKNKFI
jgi:predicted DNA binding CopG/RHH family protein